MVRPIVFPRRRLRFPLSALLGVLSACGARTPAPIVTTVCQLPSYAQRAVQVDAEISAEADGRTVIGDESCAATKIELQLSAAAARAGAAEQLKAAAQSSASSGATHLQATLTGVFTNTNNGAYFIADNVSGLPAPK